MKLKLLCTPLAAALLCASNAFASQPLGTAFTYQGRLNDAGAPANGHYDMIFNLYDAPTNGNVLGTFSIFGAVPVSNGLFTLELNANGEFGLNAFNGEARWLEIGVRTNSNNALNPWVFLTPRQALAPAPQAMFALSSSNASTASFAASVADGSVTGSKLAPGAVTWSNIVGIPAGIADGIDNDTTYAAGPGLTLSGTNHQFSINFAGSGAASSAARSDHNHFGAVWGGNAAFTQGLSVTNAAPNSSGLYGQQGAGSGFPYPFGNTAGVWGESSSGSGVFGATGWTNGAGVFGFAVATNGPNSGVFGQSMSTSGIGVRGFASATSGPAVGVRGESKSAGGYGMVGYASALGGGAAGVYGQSDAANGAGLVGRSTFVSGVGPNYGVYGQSDSLWGYGVYGYAASPSGLNFGVVGESEAPAGIGVVARNSHGVAFKAEGTGVIQSDADSILWVPGTSGFGYTYYDGDVNYSAQRDQFGIWISDEAFVGAHVAVLPVTLPTVLYGQRIMLKSIEVFYQCEIADYGFVQGTRVTQYVDATNYALLYDDNTAHKSDLPASYVVTLNLPLSETSGFINVSVGYNFQSIVAHHRVHIFGVKLRLGHA